MVREMPFPRDGEPKRALLSYWIDRAQKAEEQVAVFLATFANESRCKFCGDEIWWIGSGVSAVPLNEDLTRHAACRHAARALASAKRKRGSGLQGRHLSMPEIKARRQKARLMAAERGWMG